MWGKGGQDYDWKAMWIITCSAQEVGKMEMKSGYIDTPQYHDALSYTILKISRHSKTTRGNLAMFRVCSFLKGCGKIIHVSRSSPPKHNNNDRNGFSKSPASLHQNQHYLKATHPLLDAPARLANLIVNSRNINMRTTMLGSA